MSPLSKAGQLLKSIGLALPALGIVLTGLAPTIAPGDLHDLMYGLAIVCVALGSIIARQGATP